MSTESVPPRSVPQSLPPISPQASTGAVAGSHVPSAPPLEYPIVAENAFRIHGLSADASRSELSMAAASIRRSMKLGAVRRAEWDLPWIGAIERSEGVLQHAAGRLGNPERRLIERLFWFGAGAASLCQFAVEQLPLVVVTGADSQSAHDGALFLLLRCTIQDSQFANGQEWLTAIDAWRNGIEDDAYWLRVLELEQAGGYEPAANGDDVSRIRANAMRLALTPLVTGAKAALARGHEMVPTRLLAILRSAKIDEELRFAMENDILGPLEEAVLNSCDAILQAYRDKMIREESAAATNRPLCAEATRRFDTEAVARLSALERIAGKDSVFSQRARGVAANALTAIAADWTWANEFMRSEELYKRATTLSTGTPVEGRIQEQLKQIAPSAQWQRDKVKPIKKAPPLRTVNTVGTNLYSFGNKYPGTDFEYGTLYLVMLFIPLVPLRRYLVKPAGGGAWSFYYSVRFGTPQRIHLAIVVIVILRLYFSS